MPDGSFEFPHSTRDVSRAEHAEFHGYTPASTPKIVIEHTSRRVMSLTLEGDRFYGLLPGTNGSGPTMRRACVPDGYVWLTSEGDRARGVYLVPSDTSDELQTNPWSGRP